VNSVGRPARAIFGCLFLFATLFAWTTAFADREGEINAAKLAVRETIRDRVRSAQVVFTSVNTTNESSTETSVTGSGYFGSLGEWKVQKFDFSVRVRKSDYRTRSVRVNMSGQPPQDAFPDWGIPGGGSEYIGYFTKPSHFMNYATGIVTFAGVLKVPSADLRIYDRDGGMVKQVKVRSRNGNFSSAVVLRKGIYRAVLGLGRMADSDEVRFSAGMGRDVDWGWGGGGGEGSLAITQPRNGETVDGARVEIRGKSAARDVRVMVYDSNGRTVSNSTASVRNGMWGLSLRLEKPGRYRVAAQNVNGGDRDEISFNYRTGEGSNEDRVVVTSPRNGANVGSSRVDVQGTSTESDVQVQVFGANGRMFHNTSVAVRNGRWSFGFDVPNGRYRIVARSGSGRDTDELWFTRSNSNKPNPKDGG
jgi:hypothetical protein